MRTFKIKELLNNVKIIKGNADLPENYWLLCVQDKDEKMFAFEDTYFLFLGEKLVFTCKGASNVGIAGLIKNEDILREPLVLKSEMWTEGFWLNLGTHLVQRKKAFIANSWTKFPYEDSLFEFEERNLILSPAVRFTQEQRGGRDQGHWNNTASQAIHVLGDFVKIIKTIKPQKELSFCLIKEF